MSKQYEVVPMTEELKAKCIDYAMKILAERRRPTEVCMADAMIKLRTGKWARIKIIK